MVFAAALNKPLVVAAGVVLPNSPPVAAGAGVAAAGVEEPNRPPPVVVSWAGDAPNKPPDVAAG